MVTVVILALVTAFLAFRLYAVLGKRTGHEQQPMPRSADERVGVVAPLPQIVDSNADHRAVADPTVAPSAERGIRAIMSADPRFDPERFVDGARAAYRMVLEAYWGGDEETLADLASEEVRAAFGEAIAQRKAAKQTLDNRLIRVDRALISDAEIEQGIARVTVRFDADIAAVTRDETGEVIAGSLNDAVPTHDVWTFVRHVRSDDPNWTLADTDEAA